MSGVLGQRLGRKKSETGGLEISSKYSLQLVLGVAPGEVGVGLGEAGLGERVHDVRAGEGFGEEDDVGSVLWISAMHHSQKGRALVWGLSTRKMRTSRSIQNLKTSRRASQRPRQSGDSKLSG